MTIKPNILKDFASYNTIFSLSCLTPDEINVPNETYRLTEPQNVILRSGGGAKNKVTTAYEDALNGQVEYFIDDITIEGIVTPSKSTRTTNATFLNFTVTEPYSMGLFLQTCMIAAQQAGFTNYLQAPFMLTVEFIGYDDNGDILTVDNASKLRRNFPIRFTSVEFDVKQSGCTYYVEGIPWNEQAFIDQTESSGYDLSLSGATVGEVLQSGGQSLTTILNGRGAELQQQGKVSSADEFVITFPEEISSFKSAVATNKTVNSATVTPQNNSSGGGFMDIVSTGLKFFGIVGALKSGNANNLFSILSGGLGSIAPDGIERFLSGVTGLIMTKNPINEKLSSTVQNGSLNIFGGSKIINSVNDPGNKPQGVSSLNYDKQFNVYNRTATVVSDDNRNFSFPQGTKITKVIEEILLSSQWGQNLNKQQPDENGMVTWFKIQPNVFIKNDVGQEQQAGAHSKVYNYKVQEYKVHSSHFQQPTNAGIGYKNLENKVAKEYNYIYTGENTEIINFDIKIDTAFFTAISKDRGQEATDKKLNGQNKMTVDNNQPQTNAKTTGGISLTGMAQQIDILGTSTGGIGGAGIDNNKIRTARLFQDVIVNSDVDLVMLNLEIHGDPYFIADSGMGNYTSESAGNNTTTDGTMDYERNEIDVIVNFKTPIDYNDKTGGMFFPEDVVSVDAFSGLYRVVFVENRFINGEFTQTLQLLRRRNQERDFKSSGTADTTFKMKDASANEVGFTPFR